MSVRTTVTFNAKKVTQFVGVTIWGSQWGSQFVGVKSLLFTKIILSENKGEAV